MTPLYAVPQFAGQPTPEILAGLGLGHLVDGPGLVKNEHPSGPLGKPCAILQAVGGNCVYAAAEQEWETIELDDGQEIGVGWISGDPPGPTDLVRDSTIAGRSVRLADGREWLAPTIREWLHDDLAFNCPLPRRLTKKGGQWVGADLSGEALRLWELAVRCFNEFAGYSQEGDSDDPRYQAMSDGELLDACAQFLAVNYRVSDIEVAALGLLTVETARGVLDAATDFEAFTESLKKKHEDLLSTGSEKPGDAA